MDSSVIVGLSPAAVLAFIGWLLNRSVKGVDASITKLSAKVDQLGSVDTEIKIELANLRARVTHLEFVVNRKTE